MTKLQNFFQNPFNASFDGLKDAEKQEINKRTVFAANEVFKDKPYHVENKAAYTITKIVGWVANVVSFATGFFALQSVLSLVVGYWVASGGAMALCALLELLKNNRWQVVVKQQLKYKKAGFSGFGVLIFLSVFSIAASGYGAFILPTQIHSAPTPAYSKGDSILLGELALVNSQIRNLDSLLLGTDAKAKPNASGRVSSTFKELLTKQTAQKDSLNAQKRAISSAIDEMNTKHAKQAQKAAEAQNAGLLWQQIACLIVALLFEVIYIYCTYYQFFYLFRVYVDNELPAKVPNEPEILEHETVKNQPNEPHQNTPTSYKQIGFFNHKTDQQTNQQQYPTNPHKTNEIDSFKTVLKPFENGLVGEENGIKFVWHNGKKYTKTDVQNNVWAFRSKVKAYSTSPKKQRYIEHLGRWENYLKCL